MSFFLLETYSYSSFAQTCSVRSQGPIRSDDFWLHLWQEAADATDYNSATPSTSAWEWLGTKNKDLKLLVSVKEPAYWIEIKV